MKEFFLNLSKPQLIKLINCLFHTEFTMGHEIIFENTETFNPLQAVGNSVLSRGDITIHNKEMNKKVLIELQSTLDSNMSLRMFDYATSKLYEDGEYYVLPQTLILYTVCDAKIQKKGIEKFSLKIPAYSVNGISYTEQDNLVIEFPYINILDISLQEFQNTDMEFLKIFYPYRYLKKESNLTTVKALENEFSEILKFLNDLEDKDDQYMGYNVLSSLFRDIRISCTKSKTKKRRELVNDMILLEESPFEIILAQKLKAQEEWLEEKLIVRLEKEIEERLQKEIEERLEKEIEEKLQREIEEKLEQQVINVLDVLTDDIIAEKFNLSLEYVKKLREENPIL